MYEPQFGSNNAARILKWRSSSYLGAAEPTACLERAVWWKFSDMDAQLLEDEVGASYVAFDPIQEEEGVVIHVSAANPASKNAVLTCEFRYASTHLSRCGRTPWHVVQGPLPWWRKTVRGGGRLGRRADEGWLGRKGISARVARGLA